jgi:hypothetical protein
VEGFLPVPGRATGFTANPSHDDHVAGGGHERATTLGAAGTGAYVDCEAPVVLFQ